MAKIKSQFVCQHCGYITPKWMGKCPECNQWDSLVEEKITSNTKNIKEHSRHVMETNAKPQNLSSITLVDEDRVTTGIGELDRVLGGGLVSGVLVLVGGDPGIGKSTLLLQVANEVAKQQKKVLYISAEESIKQIKIRADRLGISADGVLVLSENNVNLILEHINIEKPDVLIIDSIQTVYHPDITSAPGSVSQVRESTGVFMRIAKVIGISTFLVGHVTKSGSIAGPKVLEHMVDTVLYFEGEQNHMYRILRAVKNRYGSTNEIGVFEMASAGLLEVKNPSHIFLSNRPKDACGSVVIASLEGTRPVLIEIQALVSQSSFGNPRRMANGVDYNRVILLMAILEKQIGLMLGSQDSYVNVIGGMSMDEPAADMAIVGAIVSSYKNQKIDADIMIFGEVGLTGEIRNVSHAGARVSESHKLGFKRCILPKGNIEGLEVPKGMKLYGVETVKEALSILFI